MPIPKPNKDLSDPTNYRLIALTSCLCKTMERMVNDRLVWVLESKKLLSKFQCGFRKDHSTLDHLVRFEHFIREAFAKKETSFGSILRPGESLRYHVETWNSDRSFLSRIPRQTTYLYSEFSY